jgi:endonuclease/exonuclease/phosphatase family metal-dependent hydrolase
MTARPDPHPASAAADLDGTVYCSSVLPWRSCGSGPPWVGGRHADKTAAVVADLDAALPEGPLVWGGDWNHALVSPEYGGSLAGRRHIVDFLQRRRLNAPTAALPHRIAGLAAIDHIAVPDSAASACRFSAEGLSDHDGYVVQLR